MLPNDTRREIENITQGILIEGVSDNCTSVRNLLSSSYPTSSTVKANFESQSVVKEEQARLIEEFCTEHKLWLNSFPEKGRYMTKGGESEVYLLEDGLTVAKINSGVYYATWLEFLKYSTSQYFI